MSDRRMSEDGFPIEKNWTYGYGKQAGGLIVYEIDENYHGEGEQVGDKPYVHWKCLACGRTSRDPGQHPKRLDRIKTGAEGGVYYNTGKFDAGVRTCGCKQAKSFVAANLSGSTVSKHVETTYSGAKILYETDYVDANRSKIIVCECSQCGLPYFTTKRSTKKSCGCLQKKRAPFNIDEYKLSHKIRSRGERDIAKVLDSMNISYVTEKRFSNCLGDGDKTLLPFDFYLEDKSGKKLVIEVDGAQHFKEVSHFGGQAGFEKRRRYDLRKDNFCFENGISVIRIPDTETGAITRANFVEKLKQFTLTPETEKNYFETRA